MSTDNISFLVENGMPLEEIQRLLHQGISLEEIAQSARGSRLRICQEGKYKNGCIFERGKRRKNPSPPQWAKGAKETD